MFTWIGNAYLSLYGPLMTWYMNHPAFTGAVVLVSLVLGVAFMADGLINIYGLYKYFKQIEETAQ